MQQIQVPSPITDEDWDLACNAIEHKAARHVGAHPEYLERYRNALNVLAENPDEDLDNVHNPFKEDVKDLKLAYACMEEAVQAFITVERWGMEYEELRRLYDEADGAMLEYAKSLGCAATLYDAHIAQYMEAREQARMKNWATEVRDMAKARPTAEGGRGSISAEEKEFLEEQEEVLKKTFEKVVKVTEKRKEYEEELKLFRWLLKLDTGKAA
ncbi:hypothetical protein H2201_008974 [Coniosporium apollinis]|uniref:Uncharacterized protein n=1 Tax=Coniosporium apollinis TaxID=61459 RepID=A0ABQ9NLF1_9PEZI|nr:hypothetical protein H2201_008974 [Coniosporium apollinis]